MSKSPELSMGKFLANLKNPAYTAAGGDRFQHGQCTWYVAGRAKEKKGVNLSELLPSPANGGDWFAKIQCTAKVTKRPATAKPVVDSIASFSHKECGHVVYIEAIRGDFIYFTEYNWNQSLNGRLQKIEVEKFPTLHGCKLNGYIIVR